MVTAAFVSLLFGVVFTYVLRREVKLPHGEGVRAWKLVSFPWSRPEHAKQMADGNSPSERSAASSRRTRRSRTRPAGRRRRSDRRRLRTLEIGCAARWTSRYGDRLEELLGPRPRRSWTSTSIRSRPRRCAALDEEVTARRRLPGDHRRDPRAGPRRGALEPLHARRGARRRADQLGVRRCSARRWAAARSSRRWRSTAPPPTPATWRSSPSTAPTSRRSVARAAARRRHPLLLLDDRARGRRLGPDARSRPGPSSTSGDWVINGHKWFTSGAVGADDRDRDGRHRSRRRTPTRGRDDRRADRRRPASTSSARSR